MILTESFGSENVHNVGRTWSDIVAVCHVANTGPTWPVLAGVARISSGFSLAGRGRCGLGYLSVLACGRQQLQITRQTIGITRKLTRKTGYDCFLTSKSCIIFSIYRTCRDKSCKNSWRQSWDEFIVLRIVFVIWLLCRVDILFKSSFTSYVTAKNTRYLTRR